LRRSTILEYLTTPPVMQGDKIRIRAKRLDDVVNEYNWRKDDELSRLDASAPVTGTLQEYINWYAGGLPQFDDCCLLAVETTDGKHIGNCGCFNIDDVLGEVELGIMIGEKSYWNQGYGEDVVTTLVNNLFSATTVQRIYLKTLDWNIRAQKCFEKCGFELRGTINRGDYIFKVMSIYRDNNGHR
jgi:RimJ/RimL family protein N-acetyltransferase